MAYSDNRQYMADTQQQLDDVNASIEQRKNEYNQYKGQSDEAYRQQQQAMANRVSYNDLLQQAEANKGLPEKEQQYKSDVEAVNAIASAMNTLPSSINANSNVVLTNAQRNAALGNQMQKYQNSYDYATREAEASGNLYQMAQSAALTAAEAGANDQQQNIANAMNAYQQEMSNLQNAYANLANDRQQKFDIYGQRYEEDYRRAQDVLQREMQERELAMKKYIADQEAAAQRYAADAGMRLQQYMDQKKAAEQPKATGYGEGVTNAGGGWYRTYDSKGNEKIGKTYNTSETRGNTRVNTYVPVL